MSGADRGGGGYYSPRLSVPTEQALIAVQRPVPVRNEELRLADERRNANGGGGFYQPYSNNVQLTPVVPQMDNSWMTDQWARVARASRTGSDEERRAAQRDATALAKMYRDQQSGDIRMEQYGGANGVVGQKRAAYKELVRRELEAEYTDPKAIKERGSTPFFKQNTFRKRRSADRSNGKPIGQGKYAQDLAGMYGTRGFSYKQRDQAPSRRRSLWGSPRQV